MNIDKFTITSFDTLTGFKSGTNELRLIMDELSDFTLSQEEEKVDITGRGGRTIGSLKKNKKVTGSGTNGMLCGGALAAQLGTEVAEGEDTIRYTDFITVNNNEGTTAETAIGTAGDEIGFIYVRNENNEYISGGKKLTQVATSPKTGEFTYEPGSKKITFFAGDVADGIEVVAFYDARVTSKSIVNDANNYSDTLRVIVDVTCQDGCDNQFHGQFICDRADFSGTFEISGGSDPSTHAFEFTTLPNLCTGKSQLWKFIVFD